LPRHSGPMMPSTLLIDGSAYCEVAEVGGAVIRA
jgi:hypothetical protein